MEYLSVKEVSKKWGLSTRRIQILCITGRIEGAERIGNMWVIPKNATKPADARIKSGKYVKEKNDRVCGGSAMDRNSFSFVVYIIHACANKWNKRPSEVYRGLQSSGCIDNYLVPHYEILHTQGTDFVVSDIEEYMQSRGVAV